MATAKPRIKPMIVSRQCEANNTTNQETLKNVSKQNNAHKTNAIVINNSNLFFIYFFLCLYINSAITRKMRALRKKNEKKMHKKTST